MRDGFPRALPGEIGRASPRAGVLVLRFDLASPTLTDSWARPLLTPQEAGRADRLVRPLDQRRARLSRALARTTLAAWLGAAPGDLAFATGPHGKPRLLGGCAAINVSHSLDRLLIAVADAGEIGVDVEAAGRPLRDLEALARWALTAEEGGAVDGLPDGTRVRAFLRLWTAKEAALKAVGVGLHRSMRDVALDPAALATLGNDAWRPTGARLDELAFTLDDVSTTDDVAVLACWT